MQCVCIYESQLRSCFLLSLSVEHYMLLTFVCLVQWNLVFVTAGSCSDHNAGWSDLFVCL